MTAARNRTTETQTTTSQPLKTDHGSDERLAQLARGIAHPLRVRILRLLLERGQCVCGDIVEEMPRAQSTVSQHLKVLKESGLIRGDVEPPCVCYCVDEDGVRQLKELIGDL